MQSKLSRSISSGPKFPLVLLLLSYAIVDFWAPAILESNFDGVFAEELAIPLIAATAGCLLSQLGVLAAWGVLGVARPVARWVGGLLGAVVLLCFFCTGGAFVLSIRDWEALIAFLLILPLAYLGVQIPIWVMNLGWGCRFTAAGAPDEPPRQFTLRSLFIATAAVAAMLGLLNLVMNSEEVVSLIGVCLLGGSVWGLLAVVPCLLFAFAPKTMRKGAVILFAFIGVLCLGIPLIALLTSGVLGRGEEFIALATWTAWSAIVFTSIAGTLFGNFCVLRHYGYALRRIGIKSAENAAVMP